MRSTLDFQPGFRLSEIDIGILITGICASVLLARLDERLAVALLFTLAHFFLFCNVLRMSRPLELVWAMIFVPLAGGSLYLALPPWNYTLAATLVLTLILALIQILRPSYHGVFWRQINPDLTQWWAANRRRQP